MSAPNDVRDVPAPRGLDGVAAASGDKVGARALDDEHTAGGRMNRTTFALVAMIGVAAMAACSEDASSLLGGAGGVGEEPGGQGGGGAGDDPPAPRDPSDRSAVIGSSAGGKTHIISDGWDIVPVAGGDNVKFLNFAQMKSEVRRATGVTWSGWDASRAAFGGADYVTSFDDDRAPSGTKLVLWRKMAYEVCGAMISSSPGAVFSDLAPTAAIAASDPRVAAQSKRLAERVFQDDADADLVDRSVSMLAEVVGAGGTPAAAWTALCAAYLSSSRFLTY